MSETTPSTSSIVDGFALCFDPGDRLNGSLYLALPRGVAHEALATELVARLRAAGLWSGEPPKWVAEQQRASYREQLRLVEAVRYRHAGPELVAARFDHPKFPSDAGRWQQWLRVLDDALARA